MFMFAFVVLAAAFMVVLDVFGLHASRKGASGLHAAAFWGGICGLLGLGLAGMGFLGLAMQMIMASLNTPAGRVFQIGIAMSVAGALVAGIGGWLARRRSSRLAAT